jgi:sulfur carrier protein ThiS
VDGVPVSALLESIAVRYPRAQPYLRGQASPAVLRVIVNGAVVPVDRDPVVRPQDAVLLMHAVAGGR